MREVKYLYMKRQHKVTCKIEGNMDTSRNNVGTGKIQTLKTVDAATVQVISINIAEKLVQHSVTNQNTGKNRKKCKYCKMKNHKYNNLQDENMAEK